MSRRPSVLAVSACLIAAVLIVPPAAATSMAKAHLPKHPFKIYDGHLSAAEKLCLRYALKQWVMYDKAPTANGSSNRNESADHVTTAGPLHDMKDVIDPKDSSKSHARSSRSMSPWEQQQMANTYGASSPFHDKDQPVKDPVTDDSWFTSDEGSADLSIEPGDYIPGVDDATLGLTRFGLVDGIDELGANKKFKSRWADSTAAIDLKVTLPAGKSWCYPTDTNHDGFITNADAKCPPNTIDYYMILKHELGHWFSFEHDDGRFELPDDPTPSFQPPASLCDSAMSPANDVGPDLAAGSEFGPRASRLYFASDRPGGYGGYDLWFVTWNAAEGRWKRPTNCGPVVNTAADEVDPHSGIGDAELYFASNRPGGAGGFDLYRVRRGSPSTWDTLDVLPNVNTAANETGPSTFLGQLLFASDRPGGIGGFDLCLATLDDDLEPQGVTNLGPAINTPADERDPIVSRSDSLGPTQLMFSSNRPGGAGGFDLYAQGVAGALAPATGPRSATAVTPAVNLAALNGPFDDTGPSTDIRMDRMFLASNRPGGHGAMDCFVSENHAPHPRVLWDGDAGAIPDSMAHLHFDVVNSGSTYATLQPQAFDTRGWGVTFNPVPFTLQPGDSRTVDVDVHVPDGTAPSDSTEVWYATQVVARGFGVRPLEATTLPFPANHAYAAALAVTDVPGAPHWPALAVKAHPNPASGVTRFVVDVPRAGETRIEVFDLLGRRVRTLHRGLLGPGSHSIAWDGRDDAGRTLRAGVLVCRVTQAGETARVVLVRRE